MAARRTVRVPLSALVCSSGSGVLVVSCLSSGAAGGGAA